MKMTARFLQFEEIEVLQSILEANPFSNGVELSKSEIIEWCSNTCENIHKGNRHVVVVEDENLNPIAFTSGISLPSLAGWIQGLAVMKNCGNAVVTGKAFAIGSGKLTENYETLGYYKFWDTTIKGIHDYRARRAPYYAKILNRYETYDERIIPPGEKSGVLIWDAFRKINPTRPVICKLFVLKQEFRLELLNK